MKRFLGLFVLLVAGYGMAADNGKVEIYGRGEVSAKPEQAQLHVSVVSLCYDKARDAREANAVLASRLVKLMESYKRESGDLVTASGGPISRQSEYIYESGTNNRKLICERKWRVTNSLTLKTSALAQLPDIQDAILAAIDGVEEIRAGVTAQTYAQLSEPAFTLRPATMVKMRAEAQQKAWADAKAQFDNFAKVCAFQNPRVISVTPPSQIVAMPKYAAPASVEGGSTPTPILPDELVVSAQWKFVWGFDPSSACAVIN